MRYLLILIFALTAYGCCEDDEVYARYDIRVDYAFQDVDTIMLFAPYKSRIYMIESGANYDLKCEGVGIIAYQVEGFKILN